MNTPKKQLEIKLKDNIYNIDFPNNRQLMAIYTRKSSLAKEGLDNLSFSIDGNARYVATLISAIATFENVMPEKFFKDLNVANLSDLDVLAGAEIVKVYLEQYEPWMNEWSAAMRAVLSTKVEA